MEQGDTDLENIILNTLPESQKKIILRSMVQGKN